MDLAIGPGEIRGLVGANGSGKSRLIKVLAGYHQPDPGARASINGREVHLGSRAAAVAAGVRFVHQDLGLVGTMTVAENLTLDEASGAAWWVRLGRGADRVRRRLGAFDLDLDPDQLVASLSDAQRTLLAVVRAIRDGLGLLVLDEPTGTLSTDETAQLFALIRRLRDRGASVLFVTHRLEEVFEIADRVTVLRDGQRVLDAATADIDQPELVEAIVGRPLEAFYSAPPPVDREVVFAVQDLTGPNVDALSFRVHRGEILGFAGLTGSGRETLAALITGAVPWAGGEVQVAADRFTALDPRTAINAGIAYVPADRKALGSIAELTVRENLTLPEIPVQPSRWLSVRAERAEARDWLARLRVKPADPEAGFATLSGGNQQRVILARWLRRNSRIFVLDEPTQGVDVAGKADIYEALTGAAQAGPAVVMASTDADELAATCDRVLVLHSGRGCAELSGDALTSHAIAHHEHGG